MSASPPLASIVVTNYNHGPFLRAAIDSALSQSHPRTEVIVVDDGSTDDSPAVLDGYGDRIVAIRQANVGMDVSLGIGFLASRGEVVLFLDSDDVLCPTTIERAMAAFAGSDAVKVHWPLVEIDESGAVTGRRRPSAPLPEGDLKGAILRGGPLASPWPPTSGNAFRRDVLKRILPVPRTHDTLSDVYLCALAPLYGPVARITTSLGYYRIHGDNLSRRGGFEQKLARGLWRSERTFEAVREHCAAMGDVVDAESWKASSWWHRIRDAIADIVSIVPEGRQFILVNGDQWGNGEEIAGRRRLLFVERDGLYWGPPESGEVAVAEVERQRRLGASHVVFAWPALWWLDHYSELRDHLRARYETVLANDRVVAFALET
jgi:glycosyltransferase involved in cell wall biosynthesis